MAEPCPTCFPINCDGIDDSNLYSLEREIFPFVLNCPPGFDCNDPSQFNMVCCGQLLSATFPADATIDDKLAIIAEIVNQCQVRNSFCGNNPGGGGTTQLYYNNPKACTVLCPDGNPFEFFVPAGVFLDTNQTNADNRAQEYACEQARLRRICLGPITGCLCVGSAYSYALTHTGGVAPFSWQISAGSLPPGLAIDQTGTISGTPTTNGTYNFTVMVTCADGSFMSKPYTLAVLEITTTVLDAYSIGNPYTFQLQAAGGSGNYQWRIKSGSLPPGLTMDNNGKITGTPT